MGSNINKELLSIMENYNLFLCSEKQIEMPIEVTKEKVNHPTSLYIEKEVKSSQQLGEDKFDCEIRNKDIKNYSYQLLTNAISKRVLFRLDEGNGTHRNNIPTIPLRNQQVPTPHFHKYDASGRFHAYRTKELEAVSFLDIKQGLTIFCKEANIVSTEEDSNIEISIQEEGTISSELLNDLDPLNGVDF